ncbi:MAG TPA: FkbM family methyltransferase [Pseudolabrys sp.]|nr:FkbM family methyltransferase [Pseudolabrys sp.]
MPRFADDSRLIFDLGMNNGDDTAYYLTRGFNVVAVEANAALCERARARFGRALEDGTLKILNAAIAAQPGEATFFVNLDNDHWSSLDSGWAGRDGSRCRAVAVRCVTLRELFEEFGVPYYLKIDVEGADQCALDQLQGNGVLPFYVSVEDCRFGFDYMDRLASCGYQRFNLLDQSTVAQLRDPRTGRAFPAGSSGPFGPDLPGRWLPHAEMLKFYAATVRDRSGKRLAPRTQWWDIHCAGGADRA